LGVCVRGTIYIEGCTEKRVLLDRLTTEAVLIISP
jgi:hypothetical protein